MSNKNLTIGVVVAIVIAIVGCFFPRISTAIQAGATNYTDLSASSLSIGTGCDNAFGTCNGTKFNRLNGGQCYFHPYATTIAASSTALVDCQGTPNWNAAGTSALTGVTFGDSVVASNSTTTAGTTIDGVDIIGASASTTSGIIQLTVANTTGTTFTWPTTGTASGTASYFDFK